MSQAELDEVKEVILEIEDALKEAGVLDGKDDPSVEAILNMEVDEEDSCDDMSPGRYSNRVNETFRQEASAPKASSSLEQAAKSDEDRGAEFH